MGRQRFKANRSDSFFGEFVYEQVLPKDHFLVQLRAIVPWERFTDKLVKYYKGGIVQVSFCKSACILA